MWAACESEGEAEEEVEKERHPRQDAAAKGATS